MTSKNTPHTIHTIYGLIDPNTHEVRYVGRSTNVDQRYKDHCSCRGEGTDSFREWQRGLLTSGEKPKLVTFTTCHTFKDAKWIERFFVLFYYIQGNRLTNRMECIKDGHLIRNAVSSNDIQGAYDLMGFPWDVEGGCLTDREITAFEIDRLRERYQTYLNGTLS